ncbi:glutathione S-transferase family protein [Roseovarius sp. A21]|uniref:Glutathione S-transferase family protein n=1 Tax=Roseovarius bejariae TaxID=2576383 RepID=A0A844D1Z3_9RHOB|nr:glutathione S-transferase family protein [Roseovarius bejariae]MRU15863.1 glutathione S-transferase family protein [Roseovarius bejariae]
MEARYILHYAPDNASLVIRLALDTLGLPYDTALVNRAAQAQKSPAYRALNPNGLIPALETPDGPMFETAAILLWLADRHGALAPADDSPHRARFLSWLFFLSNTLHPALRITFYPDQYIGTDATAQATLRRHVQDTLPRYLDMLETEAAKTHPWFCAQALSALDLYLACLLRWMALYPRPHGGAGWFTLSDWPQLHAMATRLDQSKAAIAAIRAEGLGPRPFTDPQLATPPEGSAT